MNGSSQAIQYQLQTKGIAIATDFSLAQFELVQYGFKFLMWHTITGDIVQHIKNQFFKSLSVFALRDIDLYKIESRPLPGSPWEYIFYLDFGGDIRDEVSKKAIAHLEEIARFFKFLGSYPQAVEVIGRAVDR